VKEENVPSEKVEGKGPGDLEAEGGVGEGGQEDEPAAGCLPEGGAEEDDGQDAGDASGSAGVHAGREASYGTVSSAMFVSGTDETRGSLLATFGNFPRKSEESTYFESNASTAIGFPAFRGGGGGGGSVDGGVGESFATAAAAAGPPGEQGVPAQEEPAGKDDGAVAAETAVVLASAATSASDDAEGKRGQEDGAGREEQGAGGGDGCGSSRSGGGGGRRDSGVGVVAHAADPAALLRPPTVGKGKLEHDKERRLGVAGDLEAVIAELSRRKSLLAWEDGEGAASDRSEESPRKRNKDLNESGREDEEELGLSTGSPTRPSARAPVVRKGSGSSKVAEPSGASRDPGAPAVGREATPIAADARANDSGGGPVSATVAAEPAVGTPPGPDATEPPAVSCSAPSPRARGNVVETPRKMPPPPARAASSPAAGAAAAGFGGGEAPPSLADVASTASVSPGVSPPAVLNRMVAPPAGDLPLSAPVSIPALG
ncbi:unnamed protein product, partial [Scytosiphon promiscuus]